MTFLKRLQLRKLVLPSSQDSFSRDLTLDKVASNSLKQQEDKEDSTHHHHGLVTKEYLVLVIDDIGLYLWRIGTFLDQYDFKSSGSR